MKNYYLIVRYRDINEVQVVKLNSRWYLDAYPKDSFTRANSLEAIDLVTTRFKDREQMLKRMHENGYIRSVDADVFIASKRKQNGKEFLKTYEVVYNPKGDTRISEFRDIAKASLRKNISVEEEKIKRVFDKLANKTFYNTEFSSYLKTNFTNIYQKIAELYAYAPEDGKPAYNVKYDNYWTLSSYIIIRNIIEAINRFDSFEMANDKVEANIGFLNENGVERKKVEKELLEKTDRNYIEGQYSLFDKEIVKLNKKEEDVEKTSTVQTVKDNVAMEEKLYLLDSEKKSFIMQTLRKMSSKVFGHTDSGVVIKEQFFDTYPSENDKRDFLNLSSTIIKAVYLYILHYEMYKDALKFDQNTTTLESELRSDKAKLDKVLGTGKNISKTYEWCNAYLRCLDYEAIVNHADSLENPLMEEGKKVGK